MSLVIYKYPVVDGKINVPHRHEIIHIGYQNSDFGSGIMVWAIVDSELVDIRRETVFILMTGEKVPDNTKHIRSFELENGKMCHAFKWYFGEE